MPLCKLPLEQVLQTLKVAKVLTFEGHNRFQSLPQKVRHEVRPCQSQHIYSGSQKAQPLGVYLLQMRCLCSININK